MRFLLVSIMPIFLALSLAMPPVTLSQNERVDASKSQLVQRTAMPAAMPIGDSSVRLREPLDISSVPASPLTINEAVSLARRNYPKVLRAQIDVQAFRDRIALRKVSEYMPDALFQYQEIMASRNKLTQIIYGSPVFPGNPGPSSDAGSNAVSMRPLFFSGGGFNFDWQPLDFGLHKARINVSKAEYRQSMENARVTDLDAGVSAGLSFLEAVVAQAQVRAAEENLQAFEQVKTSVDAQVRSQMRPGADAYLSEAEVARARSALTRAKLSEQIALSDLSNALGIAGQPVKIDSSGLTAYVDKSGYTVAKPDLDATPVVSAAKATVTALLTQKQVLNKEYCPTFHWLYGMQLRGSGLNTRAFDQSANVHGLFPAVPNYQLAMIVNWNFLDFARLRQEKKIQDKRIRQSQFDLELIKNNLKTEDFQTRAQLEASYAIINNTRVQLEAAKMALQQAKTRYINGLSSIAQLAEAGQALAQARYEEAEAHVGVWKVLLSIHALRGNLQPFLSLADHFQRRQQ